MSSDEELYRRVRGGERSAFRALYDRHARPLYGFLDSYVRDRAEAEDLLHETFLRALRTPEVELDRAAFRTWLYRIGRNLALNRIRARRRGRSAVERIGPAETAPSVEEISEQQRRLVAFDEAVRRLPPALLEVYRLRASGLSYEQMAEVLAVPLGTLKSRMHSMVAALRQELEPWRVK